jgi:glucuronosyltransferase
MFNFNIILFQDIQTLMDDAKDGVIYFSMGSLLRGTTLPVNKRDAFIKAFAKLNQTVLWKWEDDELPGKSPNVHTFKWISQRDVLGKAYKLAM